MNEKFFDLRKEKQDRMINAGLQIFALNGYHHASTDEIVANAQISKGLLFHYFGSKAGYYSFLYNYVTRYALLELNTRIRQGSYDYFDLQRDFLRAETALMEQYPYLFLFLESIKLEDDTEGLQALTKPDLPVPDFYRQKEKIADLSAYLHVDSEESLSSIIHYVKTGVMREILPKGEDGVQVYTKKLGGYIDSLQRLAASL